MDLISPRRLEEVQCPPLSFSVSSSGTAAPTKDALRNIAINTEMQCPLLYDRLHHAGRKR